MDKPSEVDEACYERFFAPQTRACKEMLDGFYYFQVEYLQILVRL
jgi:hypothetical protein